MAKLVNAYLNLWALAANLELEMTGTTRTTDDRPGELLRLASERSEVLAASTPEERRSTGWHYEAAHVGDLSVAALALLRR
jgi:hypothetical protein